MAVHVVYLPEAVEELAALDRHERIAVLSAVQKLQVVGDRLGFPHSSNVQGADRLRELRPRAGRSPTRALYRRVDRLIVIAAIGPEAQVDKRGFARSVTAAEQRLADFSAGN